MRTSAPSRGPPGDEFARYWVHHGLVTIVGTKMSKSAGNALAAADALHRVRPQELRYYLGQAHYRSTIEYSRDALEDAAAAYQRIERFVTRAQHCSIGHAAPPRRGCRSPSPPRMDDDLSVPAALAAVHATVRDGNYALSTGRPGERRDLPGAGAGHARGPRPRPARRRPGRQAIRTAGSARWWTRWSRLLSGSGKRRGRGATMLRRTPSGTPWRAPGSWSRTRRKAPDGNWRDETGGAEASVSGQKKGGEDGRAPGGGGYSKRGKPRPGTGGYRQRQA